MGLLWITLTSWTTFLSPQHLLCPSPGCPFIIKNSCFSPQFHTWEHSDNQRHPSLEHWGRWLKDWTMSRGGQSLSFVQVPAIPAIPDTHRPWAAALPWISLGSCLVPDPQEDKNPAWNTSQRGRGGFYGAVEGSQPRSCYPLPTSLFEGAFPKCQGGWQSWRIWGRGGVCCHKKGENRKYENGFITARSRRKVGMRRCQGSPRDTGKYSRKLSSSCFPSGR